VIVILKRNPNPEQLSNLEQWLMLQGIEYIAVKAPAPSYSDSSVIPRESTWISFVRSTSSTT